MRKVTPDGRICRILHFHEQVLSSQFSRIRIKIRCDKRSARGDVHSIVDGLAVTCSLFRDSVEARLF
jgi:hypothetical protein